MPSLIDYNDVKIEADNFRIGVYQRSFAIDQLLKEHVDDLAREVESKAKELAPRGPTGRLKTEGVIREDYDHQNIGDQFPAGSSVTDIPAFGGGRTVRGRGGRFVAASKFESPGHVFRGGFTSSSYTSSITLNPLVKHAKWVHEGTGLYGPYRSPIVPRKASYLVFYWHGRKWMKKSVRGQKPQPFLTEAYEYVRNVYEPAKLAQLRAEIGAVT